MKKTYIMPTIDMVRIAHEGHLLAGSGNNLSGTIHNNDGTTEPIGTGHEDDPGGTEGNAKPFLGGLDW